MRFGLHPCKINFFDSPLIIWRFFLYGPWVHYFNLDSIFNPAWHANWNWCGFLFPLNPAWSWVYYFNLNSLYRVNLLHHYQFAEHSSSSSILISSKVCNNSYIPFPVLLTFIYFVFENMRGCKTSSIDKSSGLISPRCGCNKSMKM